MNIWEENIEIFIKKANNHGVKMILVGGGAVNFHGYKRHSADVDFWIDTKEENLEKLVRVFNDMGYELKKFPPQIEKKEQNISVKFSPTDELTLELITFFSQEIDFQSAYARAKEVSFRSQGLKWKVLSYDDLIESKLKSQRPKDLLDVQELEKVRKD